MSKEVDASKVVAQGREINKIQFPSPVYIARHLDSHHILLGAGGGGHRFGMANVLALLHIKGPFELGGAGSGVNSKHTPSTKATPQSPPWTYKTGLDLEDEVPWCSSEYLDVTKIIESDTGAPFEKKMKLWNEEKGLIGLLALSGSSKTKLVGIFKQQKDGDVEPSYKIEKFAVLTLPNDETDPDKKPLALTCSALVVAHDENGVHVYSLDSLVPSLESNQSHASEALVSVMIESAAPIATWTLPSRVTDLHANRILLVSVKDSASPASHQGAGARRSASRSVSPGTNPGKLSYRYGSPSTSPGRPAAAAPYTNTSNDVNSTNKNVTALVLEHVVIVASVQDKTVRVGSLRIKHHSKNKKNKNKATASNGTQADHSIQEDKTEDEPSSIVKDQFTLDNKAMRLNFPLMPSSVRIVRLFALDNISSSKVKELLRAMTLDVMKSQKMTEDVTPTVEGGVGMQNKMSVGKMMFVAFDYDGGNAYLQNLNLIAGLRPTCTATDGAGKSKKPKFELELNFSIPLEASKIVADAITAISYSPQLQIEAPSNNSSKNGHTASSSYSPELPDYLMAGTVDGTVCAVIPQSKQNLSTNRSGGGRPGAGSNQSKGNDCYYAVERRRPVADKRQAKKCPALHTEPISCASYSAESRTLVSADIAQNVIITYDLDVGPNGKGANIIPEACAEFVLFPAPPAGLLSVLDPLMNKKQQVYLFCALIMLLIAVLKMLVF